MKHIFLLIFAFFVSVVDAQVWITTGDQSMLLKQQAVDADGGLSNLPTIEINAEKKYQSVDGFGFTLTGSSAFLINKMSPTTKAALLNELFGKGENAIGISYLRLSIGASDLSASVFSYDDLPTGQTDEKLSKFSLSTDTVDLVPLLKEIIAINPNIKIMGSPWSPPVWMKSNKSSKGGFLLPTYYAAYAHYFVKYIQAMKANGINIEAVTIQNEPHHGGNNPSMKMEAKEQADFIKNHLGPGFKASNINTKIIVWDHNCDEPNYPIEVLIDAGANQYIDGSAFHLYNGNISALSIVKEKFPEKNLYFTEQWTGKNGSFSGDLSWHVKNVVIGSMNNWSKVALEWNLANDPDYGPHTRGGCTECKGALTIDGSAVQRNVAYYIIAHASKFIPSGSVRIGSTVVAGLSSVSFMTPEKKVVLLVMNEKNATQQFKVKYLDREIKISLKGGAVSTVVL
jgi:glucosylceramidase